MFEQKALNPKCHGRAAPWLTMCSDSFEETPTACKRATKQNFIYTPHFLSREMQRASKEGRKKQVYTQTVGVDEFMGVFVLRRCVKDMLTYT